MKGIVQFSCCLLGAVTASAAELRVTTFERPWQEQAVSACAACSTSAATVKLALDKTDQTVIGFGTCMSELSHEALWLLPEADRAKVLNELFSPEGGAFTVIRTPIGASDFSKDFYSYCETPDDFEMKTCLGRRPGPIPRRRRREAIGYEGCLDGKSRPVLGLSGNIFRPVFSGVS